MGRDPVIGGTKAETTARILTADDDTIIQELYEAFLPAAGHTVVGQASNGHEAVEAYCAAARRPELVILDHRMPVMSGLDAAKAILALDPGARIVVVSADSSVREAALAAGAVAFLAKPYPLSELVEILRAALENPP